MADKITTTKKLNLVSEFVDNDDRTISLDNPKNDLTAAQIKAVEAQIKAKNLFIGDKAGADFLRFKSAKRVTNIHTDYKI